VPTPPISVFAVEDAAIQVCWRALPADEVTLEIGDQELTVKAAAPALLRRRGRPPRPMSRRPGWIGGPGAAIIEGLAPATSYDLTARTPGGPRVLVERFATLAPPPGRLLSRFATISDLHVGEQHFGGLGLIEDVHPLPVGWHTYSVRCARAAIAEAVTWGAEALVVKGDLTRDGEPVELREAGRLLAAAPIPVEATLGNHEFHDRATDPWAVLAEVGIHVPKQPWARDLPGIRVIMTHTWRPDSRWGRVEAEQRAQIVALAADAPSAVFVALHHHPQRWAVPDHYPPGIPGEQSRALVDALAAANPATLLASGHTHRHRLRRHGPLLAAEVGSTKDYPGTWAGYAVHEGGIRQVVRRIAAPDAICWTETTSRALAGLWGRWSPGARDERCFTHVWPAH